MTTCKPNFTTNELIEAGMPLTLASRYIQQSEFSGVEYRDLARELCVNDYCSTCLRQGLDEGGTPVRLTGVYLYNPVTKKHDHYSLKNGIGGSANLVYWDHEELDHYIHECAHCGEHVEGANSPIHDKVLAAKLHAEHDARIAAKKARPTYCCGMCGSDKVSFMQWHNPNASAWNKVAEDLIDPTTVGSDCCRCDACDDECSIVTTEQWEADQKAEKEEAGPYWHCYRDNRSCVMDENNLIVASTEGIESTKALIDELNAGYRAMKELEITNAKKEN